MPFRFKLVEDRYERYEKSRYATDHARAKMDQFGTAPTGPGTGKGTGPSTKSSVVQVQSGTIADLFVTFCRIQVQ